MACNLFIFGKYKCAIFEKCAKLICAYKNRPSHIGMGRNDSMNVMACVFVCTFIWELTALLVIPTLSPPLIQNDGYVASVTISQNGVNGSLFYEGVVGVAYQTNSTAIDCVMNVIQSESLFYVRMEMSRYNVTNAQTVYRRQHSDSICFDDIERSAIIKEYRRYRYLTICLPPAIFFFVILFLSIGSATK